MAKSGGWPKISRTFSLPIWKFLVSPWAGSDSEAHTSAFPIGSLRWAQRVSLLMALLSLGSGRVLWDWQKSLSPARWDWRIAVRCPATAKMHQRLWKSIFKPQGRSDNAGWRHHVQLRGGVTASERWESFMLNYQVFTVFKNRFFRVLLQPLLPVSAKLMNTNRLWK